MNRCLLELSYLNMIKSRFVDSAGILLKMKVRFQIICAVTKIEGSRQRVLKMSGRNKGAISLYSVLKSSPIERIGFVKEASAIVFYSL